MLSGIELQYLGSRIKKPDTVCEVFDIGHTLIVTWTLRECELEDAVGVVSTVKEVFDEYGFTWEADGYSADLYDLSPYVTGGAGQFWVASSEQIILGCGGIRWHDVIPGPIGALHLLSDNLRIGGTGAEVTRMYVRPSARRLGIASAIMSEIVLSARANQIRAIEIWSDQRFVDAHRLYERFGAQRCGERICNDPDLSPEWGMVLAL